MGGTISSGKNDGFGGLSLVDQFFQLETHFPTRNTEVPTVTFRLAVSSDLPKTARTIWGKSKSRAESNMKFRGREKNLTKKYSQQMQYNHCYTKISHKNGIPTNLLFRCINFFSTLGPDCHVFITQAWSSRRQNYRIHRVLESQPKAGPAAASPSQNVNHTLPATLDCFSWQGWLFHVADSC